MTQLFYGLSTKLLRQEYSVKHGIYCIYYVKGNFPRQIFIRNLCHNYVIMYNNIPPAVRGHIHAYAKFLGYLISLSPYCLKAL